MMDARELGEVMAALAPFRNFSRCIGLQCPTQTRLDLDGARDPHDSRVPHPRVSDLRRAQETYDALAERYGLEPQR
jgi:hypothetical protein